jgi:hypothetical protein
LASGGIKIGDILHNSLRAKFKRLCCVLKRVDGFEYLTGYDATVDGDTVVYLPGGKVYDYLQAYRGFFSFGRLRCRIFGRRRVFGSQLSAGD